MEGAVSEAVSEATNTEGLYYLVVDQELKDLLGSFVKCHPEASKAVLKLILKMYMKLVQKSKRKGKDPLVAFQNLIETFITGRLYETTRDKIDYLDFLLEERNDKLNGIGESTIIAEIREIKSIIREIRNLPSSSATTGSIGSAATAAAAASSVRNLDNFYPTDAAQLVELQADSTTTKKRKNFKELRREKSNKIIKF
ncbi:MAG: hypothetical protein HQK53_01300 [Oligoflexia bacterium]|nr:hypothetical protein [Oligoflexia bacterium]